MALAILVGLQVLDLLTTLYILKRGGRELNPLLSGLQKYLGRDGAIVVAKVGLVILLLNVTLPLWLLVGLCVFYVVIVIHNLRVIRKWQ